MDCNTTYILSDCIKTEPMDVYGVVYIKKEVTEDTSISKTACIKAYRRYRCKIGSCNEVFLTLRVALEHRRTHLHCQVVKTVKKSGKPWRRIFIPGDGPRRVFRCTFQGCSSGFKLGSQLRRHIRRHTDEKPHKCRYDNCLRRYTNSRRLKEHMHVHTGKSPRNKCTFDGCDKRFWTMKALRGHCVSHTRFERYACKYDGCGRRFLFKLLLRHHVKLQHLRPLILKCKVKRHGRVYKDRVDRTQTEARGTGYACTFKDCDRMFRSPAGLGSHLKSHERTPSYKCTFVKCKKRFPDKTKMEEHVISHAGGREFECDVLGCGIRFFDTWLMEQHVLEHPEGTCRPFSCTFSGCGLRYTVYVLLKQHSDWHKVLGDGSFVCPTGGCRKVFGGRCQLDSHIQSHVPFICTMNGCGMVFGSTDLLRWHMVSHDLLLGYVCNVDGCCMRFGSSEERNQHVSQEHKMYKCNIVGCRVSSMNVMFMERHVDWHPGGICQPFRCHNVWCDKRYQKFDEREKHMETCEPMPEKPSSGVAKCLRPRRTYSYIT